MLLAPTMSRSLFLIILCSGIITLTACGTSRQSSFYRPYAGKGQRTYKVIGKASWYGRPFHGRRTASGERYNMNAMTAAHKKLPFGALLKVTNLTNDKSVIVKVNDRGPFIRGRILDLSREAAKRLAFLRAGTAKVRIEWIDDPPDHPNITEERKLELAQQKNQAPPQPVVAQNDVTHSQEPDDIAGVIDSHVGTPSPPLQETE